MAGTQNHENHPQDEVLKEFPYPATGAGAGTPSEADRVAGQPGRDENQAGFLKDSDLAPGAPDDQDA